MEITTTITIRTGKFSFITFFYNIKINNSTKYFVAVILFHSDRLLDSISNYLVLFSSQGSKIYTI